MTGAMGVLIRFFYRSSLALILLNRALFSFWILNRWLKMMILDSRSCSTD